MTETVDNIELDKENVEFNNAAEFVRHTDKLVYLTGKAGTGKTTFLKYIKGTTDKNTVILAPTGVAAVHAGGQTIHSFFQIRPSVYVPNDKRLRTRPQIDDEDRSTIYDHFTYNREKLEIIRGLDLLIIDEISMVRCDLIDLVDRLLRVFRRKENEPFGGVQVILIGDTFQLAPIAKSDEWDILKQFYSTEFFFGSKVIEQNKPLYIELKKIYRQNEQEFIDLLNRVRINQVTNRELDVLNSKFNPTFSPTDGTNYITLATHNRIVDSTNLTKLAELEKELKVFEATVTGTFPDNIMPTERTLQLKEDAQIMFIKNDRAKRYFNGKIAKISSINENKITVQFDEGNEIIVEKQQWENIRYKWNDDEKKIEEEIIGTFTQYPIKLAWAITVHKSQGLTFEKVIADLGAAFASGQVYVALSRCTTFNGLVLKTKIHNGAIKTDKKVIEFAQNETPDTLVTEQLKTGKADFFYKKAREDFGKGKIKSSFDFFKRALKFRNDIDTDIFKKFIEVKGKRLLDFKQKYTSLIERFELANNELSEAQEKIESQAKELNNKSTKISEQNSSIGLLLEKTSEFENEIERLKKALKQTKNKLSDSQIHSNGLETKLQKTESDLRNRNKEIQNNKAEIERLKNLKWYDKIRGKK
tara:strand:+ start:68 stop:1996 length:1929 start_codon:yes stop_codon:yes gene_type:complete